VFFGNHLQQKIALADSPLDPGAFNIRNIGMRPHLAPNEFAVCNPGIREAQSAHFPSH
jgi:hypothetical protein